MALNSWQRIDRVLPGNPWGDGSDGSYSSATVPTIVYESCSGTSGGTSLTTAGTTLTNGDILLIHQSRGTGVGQWEINKVASGGGTTSITLSENLQYTYTDSGASQAQAVVIPQYTDVTVQSGTWTITGWDGNKGGILPFAAKGTTTVTGTINAGGMNGSASISNPAGGAGRGFRGGQGIDATPTVTAFQGEGTSGGGGQSTNANGSGGGGGQTTGAPGGADGGGGGNGTAGSAGSASNGTAGTGGTTAGHEELTTMVFGGGGGGGARESQNNTGSGGGGGGIVVAFCKDFEITGSINLKGGTGGSIGLNDANGGNGAGGSFLLQAQTATLGSDLVDASANTSGSGGAGGAGRIAVHHSGTVTGTTNPTFTDVEDTTLNTTTTTTTSSTSSSTSSSSSTTSSSSSTSSTSTSTSTSSSTSSSSTTSTSTTTIDPLEITNPPTIELIGGNIKTESLKGEIYDKS